MCVKVLLPGIYHMRYGNYIAGISKAMDFEGHGRKAQVTNRFSYLYIHDI